MKKLQIVMLALLVISAFGAVLATSASAEVTLLAEWLVDGAAIAAGTSQATTTTGGLLLEDTETLAGKAAVLCEGVADGFVRPNGEDETTEILTLGGIKVGVLGGVPLLCVTETTCAAATEASPIEVWPVGLPWLTLLYLMEDGKFLNLITTEVEFLGAPFAGLLAVGYELLCLVFGLNVEDTCVADNFDIEIFNDTDTLDAAIPANAEATPEATCSQSGKATGLNFADALTPIVLTSGKLLTVSSE